MSGKYYEVDRIVAKQYLGGRWKYKVHWTGYRESANSWVDFADLTDDWKKYVKKHNDEIPTVSSSYSTSAPRRRGAATATSSLSSSSSSSSSSHDVDGEDAAELLQNAQDKRLAATNVLFNLDLDEAWQQVARVTKSVTFLPHEQFFNERSSKDKKMLAEIKQNFPSFDDHRGDAIPFDQLGSRVFFFDLEIHTFALTPYIREMACLSVDHKRTWKTNVSNRTNLREEYKKVAKLQSEPFERTLGYSGAPSYSNVHMLDSDKDDPKIRFSEAFTAMLNFLANGQKDTCVLLLFQGYNDPTTLIFNILFNTNDGERDELRGKLAQTRLYFSNVRGFWQSMANILQMRQSSWKLDRLTDPLFVTETSDPHMYNHVYSLVRSHLEIDHDDNPQFKLTYDADEEDVDHHSADVDCLVLKNYAGLLLQFYQFLANLQPDLAQLRNARTARAKDAILKQIVKSGSVAADSKKVLLQYLTDDSPGDDGDSDESVADRMDAVRKWFMQAAAAQLGRFEKQHVRITNAACAFLLNFAMGLPVVREQQQLALQGRRLETYSAKTPNEIREGYFVRNQVFLSDALAFQAFDNDRDALALRFKNKTEEAKYTSLKGSMEKQLEQQHELVEGEAIRVKLEAEQDSTDPLDAEIQKQQTEAGAALLSSDSLLEKMFTHYTEQNRLYTAAVTPWKILQLVHARRNWPLWYVDQRTKTLKLHTRFCHIFLTSIKCQFKDADGELQDAEIRAYRYRGKRDNFHIYEPSVRLRSFEFCKVCKRFEWYPRDPANVDGSSDVIPLPGKSLADYADADDKSSVPLEVWLNELPNLKRVVQAFGYAEQKQAAISRSLSSASAAPSRSSSSAADAPSPARASSSLSLPAPPPLSGSKSPKRRPSQPSQSAFSEREEHDESDEAPDPSGTPTNSPPMSAHPARVRRLSDIAEEEGEDDPALVTERRPVLSAAAAAADAVLRANAAAAAAPASTQVVSASSVRQGRLLPGNTPAQAALQAAKNRALAQDMSMLGSFALSFSDSDMKFSVTCADDYNTDRIVSRSSRDCVRLIREEVQEIATNDDTMPLLDLEGHAAASVLMSQNLTYLKGLRADERTHEEVMQLIRFCEWLAVVIPVSKERGHKPYEFDPVRFINSAYDTLTHDRDAVTQTFKPNNITHAEYRLLQAVGELRKLIANKFTLSKTWSSFKHAFGTTVLRTVINDIERIKSVA